MDSITPIRWALVAGCAAGFAAANADIPVVVEPGECKMCDLFPVVKNDSGTVVLRMTSGFTGGGWLPRGFTVPEFPDGVQQANGAWLATLIMIQHTYAANVDLDLAPKVDPNFALFDLDKFDTGPSGSFLGGERRLNDDNDSRLTGARLEDFNYTVTRSVWPLGFLFGFDVADAYYHAPGQSPRSSYVDPTVFGDREEPTAADEANFAALRRVIMTCNIGPNLLTGLPNPANVAAVGEDLPPAAPETMVVASNGANYRMITGPLAPYWGTVQGAPSLAWVRQVDDVIITYVDGTLEGSDSMLPGTWTPVHQPSPVTIKPQDPKRFLRVRQ